MSASSRPTRAPSSARASARFTAVVDLPTPPLPDATAITLRMPGSGCSPPCTAWAATCQRTSTRVGPIAGCGRQLDAQVGGQLGAVAAGREAQLDLHDGRAALQPDGLHSFGVAQGHPEVRFDIILDHTAGFADAIVCHGTAGREDGMRREREIVAETRPLAAGRQPGEPGSMA